MVIFALALQLQLAADVRATVSAADLERHGSAIVRHERPSGSPGENAAIDYIVATLRADGIPVEVYAFQAYTSDPVSASVQLPDDGSRLEAITASFSAATEGLEAPLVDMGALSDLPPLEVGTGERWALVTPSRSLEGAIVLVDGLPRNVPTTQLAEMGASGIIYVNPEERLNELIVTSTWGTPSLRNFHRLPNIPVVQVKRSAGEALRRRLASGELRVRIAAEVRTGWKTLRLPVARVPAGSAGAGDEAPFVLFGGHIDAWYHGGTDEGASNAAMLELARAFYRNRAQLRRGLWVAWWPGHSNARYGGSTWFADHFFAELEDRAVAYVNVDGIGQRNAVELSATTTASLATLAKRVARSREAIDIPVSPPGRNSDQSFNGIGLPLLQLNRSRREEDGGYWWWHTADDTLDKIDFEMLERDTFLYADALAELVGEPALPVDAGAEIAAVRAVLAERQAVAGERFDFSSVDVELQALATAVAGSPPRDDLAIVRLLRPLYRVLYLPMGPFHPEPGRDLGLLPGLAAVEILRGSPAESDRYRFAETTLVRERNRLLEAVTTATSLTSTH